MKKKITERNVQDYEDTTSGAYDTAAMTPQQYRKVAFRLQKVSARKSTGGRWTFFCVCKGYWGHLSCAHGRFVARVMAVGAPQRPVFSAAHAALQGSAPAYGRKRAATKALEHQPSDAKRPSETGQKKSRASSSQGDRGSKGPNANAIAMGATAEGRAARKAVIRKC